MFTGTLIRSGNNAKTIKGDGEYETAIMYLAPFTLSSTNVCAMAELAGCVAGCLNTAGRGQMNNVQIARVNKTKRWASNRVQFMADLVEDIARFERYCQRKGVKPAVRLNGTSDIQWEVGHKAIVAGVEHSSIFEAFPKVQFYDYTKIAKRVRRQLPTNYRLVLSYSMANVAYAETILQTAKETGANVALVFANKAERDRLMAGQYTLAASWEGTFVTRPVIDGDSDDMRFLDPQGVFVGLYAKGAAKRDTSGFVLR